jgi:secretion/DNA translocation related CpaE-like protein
VVTGDQELLDDLLRLTEAAGVEVTVAPDAAAAVRDWPSAPLVVIGVDLAASLVRHRLPRRAGVVLVSRRFTEELPDTWQVVEWVGAEHVAVLPDADEWLVQRFVDSGAGMGSSAPVVAVVGGSGGVGATMLSAALAVAARYRGLDTLLIDGDPLGAGIDVMLGWEELDGLRWPDLVQGRVSAPALVAALPSDGSLAMLSFDRMQVHAVPPPAMAAALEAGRRARDLVVVDVPRRFDDASLLALTGADRCYLVVRAEIRACAAAVRVAALARQHCPALAVVVREVMPGGLRPGEVAEALEAQLAGLLPPERPGTPSVGRGSVRARRGPLAQLCQTLIADISLKRAVA